MPHRNAPLTETGRLRLARCIVEDGWTVRRAAERFQVSHTTAARWARRYRDLGPAGMADRSSRPHRSPARTPQRIERRICTIRVTRRLGPARIAARLGLAPSTVHRVLRRYGMPPLAHLDRASGARIRRYERQRPGELVHIDIKKLGNIPDGGGHRIVGRAAGRRNRQATPTTSRNAHGNPRLGHGYLHTALDDQSRLAYTEILSDETKESATAFLLRARAWFADNGVAIERVLTDNGSCYRSRLWADTCNGLEIAPQANSPLPAPDQRQGRTLPPHPGRRVGLRPAVCLRSRTPRCT